MFRVEGGSRGREGKVAAPAPPSQQRGCRGPRSDGEVRRGGHHAEQGSPDRKAAGTCGEMGPGQRAGLPTRGRRRSCDRAVAQRSVGREKGTKGAQRGGRSLWWATPSPVRASSRSSSWPQLTHLLTVVSCGARRH